MRVRGAEARKPDRLYYQQVRVVEFSAATPFRRQLEVVGAAGVLVAVHTSNLANAAFLQPGAAVVELLQRNWVWAGLDRSFQVARSDAPGRLPVLA